MAREPDDLAEALEHAIGDGYGQFAPRVRAFLAERDVEVSKNWAVIHRRANEVDKAQRKAAGTSRGEAAPLYTGTNVKSCQASKYPSRGAPFRCRQTTGLRVVRDRRTSHLLNRLMVVCRRCAYSANEPSLYSGWGGDPNPKIAKVESEYEEKVP